MSPVWLLSIFLLTPFYTNGQFASKEEIDVWYENAIQLTNKNIDSSFLLAQKIHEASQRKNYEEGKIRAQILSGYYYWEKFKLDTAKQLLNASIAFFDQHNRLNRSLDHGRAWFYLGLVSIRQQEMQNAKLCGSNALSIFKEINNSKYIGNALNFLGGVQMSLTNYASSLDYFTQAYKTKLDGGEPLESCLSEIANIAVVYSNMGLFDDAIEFSKLAYRTAVKINDANIIVNSLNRLGSINSSRGQVDSAIFYFNKAKIKAIEFDKSGLAYVAEFNIANTYSNNGKYAEANVIVHRLLNNSQMQMGGMLQSTIALHSKNHLRLGNYDTAILIAKPLYAEVLKKGNKQMAINITEILWKSFQKKKRYDSAFKYLDTHFHLKDSVYNVENQRKLSSLYAEMESIEKENEIKILEKESELQNAENRNLIILIICGSVLVILSTTIIILAYRNREKKQKIKNLELQDEIDKRKNDLHQQALRIIYINNGLTEIESSLKKMKLESSAQKTNDIQQLLNMIHMNKSLEKEWENFNEYFGSVHGSFYEKINSKYPELSTSEKRLASLIKMNLTNREIASILNIESTSVKMAKYRLKKKLNLEEEVDIQSFLQALH